METAGNQGNARPWRNLTQVKVSVDQEIASAFKRACAASNVSMAAELSRFMADYANGSVKPQRKAAPNYSERRYRRATLKSFIKEMELIKACEELVLENTPDNLRCSTGYEATEEAIASIEEAIDALAAFWIGP